MDKAILEIELNEAERKAHDALGRYKFMMFGYWAAVWVHLNHIGKLKKPNPFKPYVEMALKRRGWDYD